MKKIGIFIVVIVSLLLIPPGVAAGDSDVPEHSLFVGDTAVSIDYLVYHPVEAQNQINELIDRQEISMEDLWYRIDDGSIINVRTNDEATQDDIITIEARLINWIDENGVSHPIVTYTVTFYVNIDDAVVTFDGVEYDAGVYVIDSVKPGIYNYTVTRVGYTTSSGTIEVQSDMTIDVILEETRVAVGIIRVGAMTFNEVTINEVYGVFGAAKFSVEEVNINQSIGGADPVTFMGTGTTTVQIYDEQETLLATGPLQIPGSIGDYEISVDLEIVSHDRYTLDISIIGQGTVTPDVGTYEYNEGSVVAISAIPDDDWKFSEWQVNDKFYSDEAETTITMDANKSATAIFIWDGGMTKAIGTIKVGALSFNEVLVDEVEGVESATHFGIFDIGGLREIGGDTPITFLGTGSTTLEIYDSQETLLATGTLKIPVSQGEHPFTVGLEIIPPGERYTLEMSTIGQGTVTPDVGLHQYAEETIVDISAVSDDDWEFDEWQVNGEFYSENAETTITMDTNKSATAIFIWDGGMTKATGTIKVGALSFSEVLVDEVGGVESATHFGIFDIGGLREIGGDTPVSFTGTGSTILEIYDSQETLLATGSLQIPVSQGEHPFTVGLEIVPPGERYTLEISTIGQGTVTPDVGLHQYAEETIVDISAVSDDDWEFDEWQVNGEFYSENAETTITMDADKELTAIFTLKEGVRKATGIIKVGGFGFNELLVNEVAYVDGATHFSVTEVETSEEIGGDKVLEFTGTGSTTLQITDSDGILLATGTLMIPVSQGEQGFEVKLEFLP
ncbi:MAG: hypothetical protein U9N40_03805 [Euryarchaeota archaeon]|nr:hypothetical protein [Euryarchaeota archaeon]